MVLVALALVAQFTGTGGAVLPALVAQCHQHWWRSVPALVAQCTGTGGAV